MLKKIKFLLLFLFLLTGCTLGNTPTSRVEELLSSYQRLDKNIVISYEKLSSTVEDANLISEYQKLVKRQYQNMVYEIKDEKINGDLAIVSVSISVFDYGSVVNICLIWKLLKIKMELGR